MNSCSNCNCIDKTPFCHLPKPQLDNFDIFKQTLQYKTNQSIFRHGDEPKGLYCLSKGLIKILDYDSDGKTIMLHLYQPGSVLGYTSLFLKENYKIEAVCKGAVELCFIPKETILQALQNHPSTTIAFLAALSKELHQTEERLKKMANISATARIVEALLILKENLEDVKWTRKDIADWAGTSPETVIRTLAKFEEQGLLKQEGHQIHILKKSQLLDFISFH